MAGSRESASLFPSVAIGYLVSLVLLGVVITLQYFHGQQESIVDGVQITWMEAANRPPGGAELAALVIPSVVGVAIAAWFAYRRPVLACALVVACLLIMGPAGRYDFDGRLAPMLETYLRIGTMSLLVGLPCSLAISRFRQLSVSAVPR